MSAFFGFACRQRHIHVVLLLVRAERDAQRAGPFYPGFAWVSGPIQHLVSQEDAKLLKPPQRKAALLLFFTVLDEKASPGRGKEPDPSGSCSARFRTVPHSSSKGALFRPWRPGSYPTRSRLKPALPSFSALSFGLGGPRAGLFLPVTPFRPRGRKGSAARYHGYYSDYLFERKVAGKPI